MIFLLFGMPWNVLLKARHVRIGSEVSRSSCVNLASSVLCLMFLLLGN